MSEYDIDGLCGDPICRARAIARLTWPEDPLIGPLCDQCSDAVQAALRAETPS